MVDWDAPAPEASSKRLLYELILGLLVMIGPAIQLVTNQTISLVWFGFGVLVGAIFYVSLFTAPVQRFNKRTDTGTIGSIVVVVGMATAIITIIWLFIPPIIPSLSVVLGTCSSLVVGSALRLLKRFRSPDRQHPA